VFCALVALGACPAAGRTLVVSQDHPKADDAGAGTAAAPFETISRAAHLPKLCRTG
jgi:hypothetical protein